APEETREELTNFSLDALEQVQAGAVLTQNVELTKVEKNFYQEALERSEFLNKDDQACPKCNQKPVQPTVNKSKDAEKKEFKSREELIESLASDRESTRWVSTSHTSPATRRVTSTDRKISLQMKMEFLGVTVPGPTFSFNRDYS